MTFKNEQFNTYMTNHCHVINDNDKSSKLMGC